MTQPGPASAERHDRNAGLETAHQFLQDENVPACPYVDGDALPLWKISTPQAVSRASTSARAKR